MGYLEGFHTKAQFFSEKTGTAQLGIGQQDRELLAAVSGSQVRRTFQRLFQGSCNFFQCFISCQMAAGIIVVLEKINIDHNQGKWGGLTLSSFPFQPQSIVESPPVRDTCQTVLN